MIALRFLAELTKEVFNDLESSKYQHAEMRVSVYGRKAMEWVSELADCTHATGPKWHTEPLLLVLHTG